MNQLFNQVEVDIETGEKTEVFVNPNHIVGFKIHDDKLVAVDFVNGVSTYLLGDYFTVMAQNALDIIPLAYQEEPNEDVNKTEYVDETPLEEPGTVDNISYEETDGSGDQAEDLKPEQYYDEELEYEPTENAQVEGAKY